MSFAVLFPCRRGHRAVETVANILETTPELFRLYIAVCDDATARSLAGIARDALRHDNLDALHILPTPYEWTALRRCTFLYEHSDEDVFFFAADDFRFHLGWSTRALEIMAEVDGVVTVNDLHDAYPVGAGPMFSRRYVVEESCVLDEPRTLFPSGYHHGFADIEIIQTAMARHRFGYCQLAAVEHLRHDRDVTGALPNDDTYTEIESHYQTDQALYESRRHLWEAVV